VGFSKRKPYLKGKSGSEKDYGLKKSWSALLKSPVRYLMESHEKESKFEKPYQVGDYPSMHLRWPKPSWPTYPPELPPGPFGGGPRSKIHTIIFANPGCFTGVADLGCEDIGTLTFSVWNTPPHEFGGRWVWEIGIAGTIPNTLIKDIDITDPRLSGGSGQYGTVILTSNDQAEEGKLVVCGTATWHGTPPLKAISVDVPEGMNPFFAGSQALGRPFQDLWANPIRVSKELERSTVLTLVCCQDVDVSGCCNISIPTAWDDGNSDDTIARPNGGGETAALAVTGTASPFTWSVAGHGSGLTLDYAVTEGLENTLRADAAACGEAKITVTGCDGVATVGYVQCTTGRWRNDVAISLPVPATYDGSSPQETGCCGYQYCHLAGTYCGVGTWNHLELLNPTHHFMCGFRFIYIHLFH